MFRTITWAGAVSLGCAALVAGADVASRRMFDRLQGLAGEWEGRYEWAEGRAESGTLKATYYVTGNGSAIVENLIMGDVPSMTTVYHLDGPDLRMTHFCAAKNQPRLKATRIDEAAATAEFTIVDVTNITAANPGHVVGLTVRVVDPDAVTLQFRFDDGSGKGAIENISLKRARTVATHP